MHHPDCLLQVSAESSSSHIQGQFWIASGQGPASLLLCGQCRSSPQEVFPTSLLPPGSAPYLPWLGLSFSSVPSHTLIASRITMSLRALQVQMGHHLCVHRARGADAAKPGQHPSTITDQTLGSAITIAIERERLRLRWSARGVWEGALGWIESRYTVYMWETVKQQIKVFPLKSIG